MDSRDALHALPPARGEIRAGDPARQVAQPGSDVYPRSHRGLAHLLMQLGLNHYEEVVDVALYVVAVDRERPSPFKSPPLSQGPWPFLFPRSMSWRR